jgi:L-amino acid N-acyltransferase YncA
MIIHPMQAEHWPRVAEIYQMGMDTKNATFESTTPSWDQWDSTHHSFARLVVIDNNDILGWAALAPVSKRQVYSGVAEVSVYVDPLNQNKGCGSILLQAVILESEKNGIWTLQASIFPENEASLRLHARYGFREVGRRSKIGKMDGVWRDTILLERRSTNVG